MGLSFGHILLVLIIILILFGAGKLPKVMTEMSRGLKAFRDGMKEDEDSSSLNSYSSPLPPLSLKEPGVAPDARRSGRVSSVKGTAKKKVLKKGLTLVKSKEKEEKTPKKTPASSLKKPVASGAGAKKKTPPQGKKPTPTKTSGGKGKKSPSSV
jgi:sec-independent protein translocase protein TatA